MSTFLIEERSVVPLQNGYFDQDERQKIPELYSVLQSHYASNQTLYRIWNVGVEKNEDFERSIQHGYNLSILAEPQVPMRTIHQVLYNSAMAGYSGMMLTGWHEDQIKGVLSRPAESFEPRKKSVYPSAYPLHCTMFMGSNQGWVRCGDEFYFASAPDCSNPDWDQIFSELSVLNRSCAFFWEKGREACKAAALSHCRARSHSSWGRQGKSRSVFASA